MSKSALGRKMSNISKEKLRKANIGDKNLMYGKRHSKESRKLIGQSHKKKVEVIFVNGTINVFHSRNECAEYFKNQYGIGIYTIKKLLRTGEKLHSKYKKFQDVDGVYMRYILTPLFY